MTAPTSTARAALIGQIVAILLVLGLIGTSIWLMAPFLTALIWAVTLAVATWPMLVGLQRWLGGRRGLAVTVMTSVLLLVFFVPLMVMVGAVVNHADEVVSWGQALAQSGFPPPPAWVERIPLAGRSLARQWSEVAALDSAQLVEAATPWLAKASRLLLSSAGGLLMLTLQVLLTAAITAILYANGEQAADTVIRFARRLSPVHGEGLVRLSAKAIRGVALGVVLTALLQTLVSAAGLFGTSVPGAPIITALVLVLCLAQVGPLLVLAPVVGWLYWAGRSGPGTLMLVTMLVAVTMDNFLRPVLIKRGADLPLLLVFSGVIGGMLTFGIIGIFVGPVILAVTYTLLGAWLNADGEPAEG